MDAGMAMPHQKSDMPDGPMMQMMGAMMPSEGPDQATGSGASTATDMPVIGIPEPPNGGRPV